MSKVANQMTYFIYIIYKVSCPNCLTQYEIEVLDKTACLCSKCRTAFEVNSAGRVSIMPKMVGVTYCGQSGNVCTGFGGKKGQL